MRRLSALVLFSFLLVPPACTNVEHRDRDNVANNPERGDNVPHPPTSTFSIVAFDPETKELGIAVQSKFLGVGAVVPWAKAGVGAVATQAWANTTFGPKGLELMAKGSSAKETMKKLIDGDRGSARRQVGIVDAKGNAATFTGERCSNWAGGTKGKHYCAQGNILAGEKVVQEMGRAFEETEGDLGDRLIAALMAGQAAGGDRRGKQSAALLIVKERGGYSGWNDRYRDVRVDDHKEPIQELARIYKLHKQSFRQRSRRGGQRGRRGGERGRRDRPRSRPTSRRGVIR